MSISQEMGDLHSIPYFGNPHSSSIGWDFHNLQVFNADISHSCYGGAIMDSSTPPFYSSLDNSDLSTGYLQDALFEFSSKRRRLMLLPAHDETNRSSSHPIPGYWSSNCADNSYQNFGHLITINSDNITGKSLNMNNVHVSEEVRILNDIKTPTEETISVSASDHAFDSSSSSQNKSSVNTHFISDKENLSSIDHSCPSGESEKRKKKVITRVVYPFAMVKPGGFKGDMTLNDINEIILMPPTRPVKHPVGDFACRSMVSPDGPGLSGKSVVALTRIQTQGRGTITIIRTKD